MPGHRGTRARPPARSVRGPARTAVLREPDRAARRYVARGPVRAARRYVARGPVRAACRSWAGRGRPACPSPVGRAACRVRRLSFVGRSGPPGVPVTRPSPVGRAGAGRGPGEAAPQPGPVQRP
ncbi:hypothetical protein GCM10010358_04270 [Streptomyces minutiscleroticus]|uniref:Uncharacterized protein n=1 Tax=Streptomyces minutiscleroticus TaxID=68238 RepID=A0A918K7J9_9ACTN|nr:hypothetical protein GCM10010358_04270 [Streptomyces minutiscleroticus]